MTTVSDILTFLDTLAPSSMKMEWDNVGLLCGSKNTPVSKILVALDPFEAVCQEAVQWGAQLLVTHHPLIFVPPKAITDDTSVGRVIMMLLRHGVCAINAHTNLDCAPGGVNDVLAEKLGLADICAFGENDLLRAGQFCAELPDFLAHVKQVLGCEGLRYVCGSNQVNRVAVGGGACAGGLMDAFDAGCDTFVTADVKYNQFWDARDLGMNLIDAGHFYTENPVIPILADRLAKAFPEVEVKISETHRDCMKFF